MENVQALTFDFGTGKTDDWFTVNDAVMGGVSVGTVTYTDDALVFAGALSRENNGGFASLRSRPLGLDLTPYRSARLRIRTDGRPYDFRLITARQVSYKKRLEAPPGDWAEVTFPLPGLPGSWRGRPTGDTLSAERLGAIESLGFILSDKLEQPFRLEVDHVVLE